ncbi:MAG TPA: hypothetical protein PLU72_20055 [Candidatus Ozemobacteraceae bacterium]|nr:hypothetical protein [Candidatus Ozemobacteraceae bacterium]HQG28581.1 hypothetical protein [Candidatus Ozemobacteraceae bacterium]
MFAKNRVLWIVFLVVLTVVLDGAAHAAVPGIGRLFSQFGKAGARKAIGKTAGKAVAESAGKAAGKALTSVGSSVTRETVTTALEKAAPRSLIEKVTPGQILAVGGAAGIVIAADGAADAMHEIANPTGNALGKAIDGTATSSERVIGELRGFFDGVAQSMLFYTSVLFFCASFILFWRFGLMPWHRKSDAAEAPARGGKPDGCGSPPAPDISDAEVVGARNSERNRGPC